MKRLPLFLAWTALALASSCSLTPVYACTVPGDGTCVLFDNGSTSKVSASSTTGFAAVATSGSATDLTSGTLASGRLPNPSASTLGGVESYANVSHQWISAISTLGVPSSTQPAFTDLSGTLTAAQLPNPTASTLGGVESYASVSHQWINAISTSGVPSSTQPAFTDISGTASAAQLPNPSASTLGGVESLASVAHKWINAISTSGVPSATQPDASDLTGLATIATSGNASDANGTTTNDNSASGKLGEIITSNIVQGSSVAATTGTPLNVTSVSLTAGDWDVTGWCSTNAAGSTVTVEILCGSSTTSATFGSFVTRLRGISTAAGGNVSMPPPTQRYSLASTTTVYLVGQTTFSVSTSGIFGFISARRPR